MEHFDITVTGNVQGVFFRDNTKKTADKLGINGFVKNQPDGTVYIEAEAKEGKLLELVEWCKTGSPKADVSDVQVVKSEPKGYESFVVKH